MEVEWLINNAGFGSMGDFVKLDLERELKMIELNIRVLVALTHRYLQPMRERGQIEVTFFLHVVVAARAMRIDERMRRRSRLSAAHHERGRARGCKQRESFERKTGVRAGEGQHGKRITFRRIRGRRQLAVDQR